jgi:hypothetical protein
MRRRVVIPQRKRIFLGCEGESEQSYGALLTRIVGTQRQDFFLDTVLLRPGGGDPFALVELAVRKKKQGEKKGPYATAFILMDSDKNGLAPVRDQQAVALAQAEGLILVWQEPCHEALLLRHLPGAQNLRPQSTALAINALRARWAGYSKGMPAIKLSSEIDVPNLRQARAVEPMLATLLGALGFQ